MRRAWGFVMLVKIIGPWHNSRGQKLHLGVIVANARPFDASDYCLDILDGEMYILLEPMFTKGSPVPVDMEQKLLLHTSECGIITHTVWALLGIAWSNYQRERAPLATQNAYSAKRIIERQNLDLPLAARLADALIVHYATNYPEVRQLVDNKTQAAATTELVIRVRDALKRWDIGIGE